MITAVMVRANLRRISVVSRSSILVSLASLAMLAGGCASALKPYPNTLPKNLQVHAKTDPNALFSWVDIDISIYEGVSACQYDYRGTMRLGQTGTEIGLPVGNPSYLQFWFTRSSLNSSAMVPYGVVLTPQAGYTYTADVHYAGGTYHAVLYERGATGVRPLEHQPLPSCVK